MAEQPTVQETHENSQSGANANKATGKKKWLSRFVTFLIMGGWMLILILGLAIAIVISVNFK